MPNNNLVSSLSDWGAALRCGLQMKELHRKEIMTCLSPVKEKLMSDLSGSLAGTVFVRVPVCVCMHVCACVCVCLS